MLSLSMYQEEDNKRESDFGEQIDALLSVLHKEVEIYSELNLAMAEEKNVLKKSSLDALCRSNSSKETLLLKARMLEEVRAGIVKKIARLIDLPEQEINMTFLADRCDERRSVALRAQQKTLRILIQSIDDLNENNKVLLDYSLSYVRSTMNFINNILSTDADYLRTGKLKTGGLQGRIIYKEG